MDAIGVRAAGVMGWPLAPLAAVLLVAMRRSWHSCASGATFACRAPRGPRPGRLRSDT